MSKRTWREVVSILRTYVGKVTSEQLNIIDYLGKDIDKDLPHLVVAAKLRDHLADVLALPHATEPSDQALSYIEHLRKKKDGRINPESNTEAEAWIEYLRLLRRVESLEKSKIETGDIVELIPEGSLAEVSSIGEDGRVYFKGGCGAGSWPDQIKVRAIRDDTSIRSYELRKTARNLAALVAPIGDWSQSKHKELENYATKGPINEDDIDRFERVIDDASDERPIQIFLEENPNILTALLGGKFRYCLPQKRLGAEYVPDFLIGDTDSLGINWVMIELETPRSSVYLKKSEEFDEYARKGVSQIREWREWLLTNIVYARNKRRENGLGLIDIRPSSRAIVLVGKRANLRETKEVARNQLREKENIHVHTYDWLLEQLRGALVFSGPARFNPYLINPEADDIRKGQRRKGMKT